MLASGLLVEKALISFTSAWYEMGDDPGDQLRQIYIDENPHPDGKKADLYNGRDGSKYSIRHGFYHRWFRRFLEDRGYYDIFLFTPAGDLIYTVAKETDYATNFEAGGPWADTNLGKVFRTANDNLTPGFQTFTDFETYGPSNDAPASFIAQPVFDGGGIYLGALALQMPIGRINQVMQVSAGMGETGEAYLVGADLLMRTDSQFSVSSTILETKVDTEPVRKALAGESGVEVVPEHRGTAMVSAFGPLEFMGVRWAVIAEIGQAELLAPIAETGKFMLVAVALILVLVTAVGIVLARGISRPIVEITRNMRRLAAGDLDVEIGSTDRTDEIGEMAAALDVFKENAVRRQMAEEELARKEAQLRIAMENMPGGMFMLDENLVIQVYNDQYKEMYELPDEAVQEGVSLAEAVRVRAERGDYGPGDLEELIEQRIHDYIERMTLRHEERLPNGRIIELLRTPIEGGGVVGIATDITERKHAEDEIEKSRERLQALADNLPEFISMTDPEGRFLFVNKRYEEWVCVDRNDIVGKTVFDLYPEEQATKIDAIDQRALDAREVDSVEVDETYPDGQTRTVIRTRFSVISSQGEMLGLGNINHDITERKQAEEALRIARDAAEEATKAKATFLATMSHEIRTPMGGVIGMVDLLQQSKLTDDQRQMIDTVRDSAHSLLTIINDILDFSKIEAGKLDLEEIPISIRDIIEGAGEALAVNARSKGIGLSVYVDPDIPDAIVGDQVRLRQILFNFGSNAIKFTEQGKVLIRADKVPSRGKKKVTVRLQVIDEGIGIPEKAQAKLFQAFSQVEASTTRRFGGTGLGLSICQRLTEMMNGEIGVESMPGEGSTFSATITFPVAEEYTIKSDGHDLDGLNVLFAIGDDDMRVSRTRFPWTQNWLNRSVQGGPEHDRQF